MRLSVGLVLALSISSIAIVGACKSDPDPTPAPATGDGGVAASDGGAGACGATTSYLECRICCGLPEAAETYGKGQIAFQECLCNKPCKDVCATTACSLADDAGAPTAECQACLESDENGKTCFPEAQAVCDTDPKCKEFQACDRASDCNAKDD